jgi:glycolate oxidase FAD binding subunit
VEATVKLRPRPDDDRLVAACFTTLAEAGAAARAIIASDLIPSALELADAEAARAVGLSTGAALLMGVDGIREQVEWQCAEAKRLMAPLGCRESRVLDGAERDQAWKALGELGRTGADDVAAVMSWGVLPTQLVRAMDEGRAIASGHGLRSTLAAHAGMGIATAVLGGGDASAVVATLTEWRALVNGLGGHAALQWAPLGVKERVSVWDAAGPDVRIMKGIKEKLDPRGILNPGRFVGGI